MFNVPQLAHPRLYSELLIGLNENIFCSVTIVIIHGGIQTQQTNIIIQVLNEI